MKMTPKTRSAILRQFIFFSLHKTLLPQSLLRLPNGLSETAQGPGSLNTQRRYACEETLAMGERTLIYRR